MAVSAILEATDLQKKSEAALRYVNYPASQRHLVRRSVGVKPEWRPPQ